MMTDDTGVILLLLVIFSTELFITNTCANEDNHIGHECIHDKIASKVKGAPPKLTRKRRSDDFNTFTNNRFHVHPDESLINDEDLSYLWTDTDSPLWSAINTISKGLLVRSELENITIEGSCDLFASGVNEGFCINGTVTQTCGVFGYPDYLNGLTQVCDNADNAESCGFQGMQGSGVAADYILLVGAKDDAACGNSTYAFASSCNFEYGFYRPLNGYINICPQNVKNSIVARVDSLMFNLLIHELNHAMGFSYGLFSTFYNDVVLEIPVHTETYGNEVINVFKSPKVTEYVQDYFNCSYDNVDYAPLENNGGAGSASSHWEARIFHHETMTAFISNDYQVYSDLTWRFFDDSQWYQVNYTFTNMLNQFSTEWGKDEGCEFITGSCNVSSVYTYACESEAAPHCTFDRISKGVCSSQNVFFDGCQVVESSVNGSCLFDINYNSQSEDLFDLSQSYGKHSRCFDVQDIPNCNYVPACYETKVFLYEPTNEYAYQIIANTDYDESPVWCLVGKHVTLGSSYVFCPPVEDILIHTNTDDIEILPKDDEEFVPPPLCHPDCMTCSMPNDEMKCLTCHNNSQLIGEPPGQCNGTYQEIVEEETSKPLLGCLSEFDGCCTGNTDECRIIEDNHICFCDYTCYSFDDCCHDINETCPLIITTTTTLASTTTETTSTEVSTTEATTTEVSTVVTDTTTTETLATTETTTLVQSTIEATTTEVSTTETTTIAFPSTTETTTNTLTTIAPSTTEVIITEVSTTEPSTIASPSTTETITNTLTTIAPSTTEATTTEVSTTETSTIAPPSTTETTTNTLTTIASPSTTEVITTEVSTTETSTIASSSTTEVITTEVSTTETSTIAPSTTEVITTEVSTTETSTIASPSTTDVTTTEVSTTETSTIAPSTTEVITTEVSTTETSTIAPPSTTETTTNTLTTIAPSTTEVITTEVSTTETSTIASPSTTEVTATETNSMAPSTTEATTTETTSTEMTTTEVSTTETTTIVSSATESTTIVSSTTVTQTTTTTSVTVTPTASPTLSPFDCKNDDVRIVNNDIVEWCTDNVWGSVCYDSSWDYKDAIVLCKQLELPSSGAYTGLAVFADDTPPIHVQGFGCTGDEDSLSSCPYSNKQSCSSGQVAKAFCVEGINDCDQCNKPVECASEGLSLQNNEIQVSGSLLTCAVQFNISLVNLTDIAVDTFEQTRYLSGPSVSLVKQLGVVNREELRANQEQCSISENFPQHGDPIATLQEIGIEVLRIIYQTENGFSRKDFTHSELRDIIQWKDYSSVFNDDSISCSFQHLLYWLTKVPTFAPSYCRQETDEINILIDTFIQCHSPFESCDEVFHNDSAEPGEYPIEGPDGVVEIQECMNGG